MTFVWLKLYYLIYWVDCISCTQILTFWIIFSENQNDPAGCISGLKAEISQLEVLRYNLLRYLIRFLVVVAQFERSNKMSPMSLAIVFGPNLFRYLFIFVQNANCWSKTAQFVILFVHSMQNLLTYGIIHYSMLD